MAPPTPTTPDAVSQSAVPAQLSVTALAGELVLAALARHGGVGALGLTVGAVVLALGLLVVGVAARRAGVWSLGPAGAVTVTRGVLVAGVAALVPSALDEPAADPLLIGLAVVSLALDAVDGPVARRAGTASAFGARFDMEVDALALLVLCVPVGELLGWWVLAIGVMRYAFVAAGWVLPRLRAPLPFRRSAKVVAAVQGVVLVVAASGVLPSPVAGALVGAALAALGWSFGCSVLWLARAPTRRPELTIRPPEGARPDVSSPR